jgi:hypothetical protein
LSEQILLSAVLDEAKGKTPLLPFPATYDGEPYTARAIFGRSVEIQARDGYKVTLRQESVRVNPDHIHWATNGAPEPPEQQEEKKEEMARPHKSQGKQTNRISLAEASALKAKGLKRCWKCKRDMPIADLNSGGMCRNGIDCAAAKALGPAPVTVLHSSVQTATGFAAVTTSGPAVSDQVAIKRSIKAKASRRGKKKRKYTRRQVADVKTTPIKSATKSHPDALTFADLLGDVKRLKSEHAVALGTITKLQAEKAAMHKQLQEILG